MAKFERQFTAEQVTDICAKRVQGVSIREIARQHGVNPSTVSRLCKQPDVLEVIEHVQAEVRAEERERDAAVQRDKERERQRTKQARRRARDAAAAIGASPDGNPHTPIRERTRKTGSDRPRCEVGAIVFDQRTGHVIRAAGFGSPRTLESESEEAWLIRKQEERELPPLPKPIRVEYVGTRGPGVFGVNPWDTSKAGKADLWQRAELLVAEGIGANVNEVVTTLCSIPAGTERIELRYEPEQPDAAGESAA